MTIKLNYSQGLSVPSSFLYRRGPLNRRSTRPSPHRLPRSSVCPFRRIEWQGSRSPTPLGGPARVFEKRVLFIRHHLSHAASAFLASPFDEAAILTADGVGEWATTTYGYGKEKNIKILKELHFPASLGLLYTAVTTYLGFGALQGEGKVMGPAAIVSFIYAGI